MKSFSLALFAIAVTATSDYSHGHQVTPYQSRSAAPSSSYRRGPSRSISRVRSSRSSRSYRPQAPSSIFRPQQPSGPQRKRFGPSHRSTGDEFFNSFRNSGLSDHTDHHDDHHDDHDDHNDHYSYAKPVHQAPAPKTPHSTLSPHYTPSHASTHVPTHASAYQAHTPTVPTSSIHHTTSAISHAPSHAAHSYATHQYTPQASTVSHVANPHHGHHQPTPQHAPQNHGHSYSTPVPYSNPWTAANSSSVDQSNWYSQTLQYSPPKIAYKSNAEYATFAVCETSYGDIQLAQLPHKPTVIRGAGLSALAPSTTYILKIFENGKVVGAAGGQPCTDNGVEFNPLTEINKYGQVNPFQDPARGRIDDFVSDAQGQATFLQNNLEQNINGKDGILGRSITISTSVASVVTLVECCTISLDIVPEAFRPKVYPYQQSASYNHGHSHH